MNQLLSFAPRHPWAVLAVLLVTTTVAALQLDDLSLRIRTEAMLAERSPERQVYDRVVERFGAEGATVILLADDDLLAPGNLAAVREAIAALEDLPFVAGTDSLFSTPEFRNEEGFISAEPYLPDPPLSREQAEAAVRRAAENPLLAGNLVSSDGRAMAVNLRLSSATERTATDDEVAGAIEAIVQGLDARLDTAFQIGGPYVRDRISDNIRADQQRIVPAAVVLLLFTVAVMLRSLHAALIPLVTAGLSVVWTLALMAVVGVPVNVLTSVIPALIVVIGSTEDIHLLAEYFTGVRLGGDRRSAVRGMARRLGTAVLLTFLTTYVGFLSIALNDITLLRQFGVIASAGLFFNFLITVSLVPIYLRYLGPRPARVSRGLRRRQLRSSAWLVRNLSRHQRLLLWSLLPVAFVFSIGASRLVVDNDPLSYFAPDSPVVQRAEMLHERLSGMNSLSVVLRSGIEGTFLHLRYLEEVREIQDYLESTGRFDKTVSFVDYVELINMIMDEEVDRLELPEADAIVEEFMLFVRHRDIAFLVTEDFAETRILVRHDITSSAELSEAVADIEAFLAENLDPGLQADVTGLSVLTAHAADSVAGGQVKSLLLMLVVIVALVSLLFVNIKAGLLALVPNLLPIIVLFGVMGFAGIALDTSTAMVAVIALGISIDDTLHFMARYHGNARRHLGEDRALLATVRDESTPIVATSIALGLGFAALALSSFPPIVHFGLLTAMVMLLALLATFILTPVLLCTVSLITLWDILSLRLESPVCVGCSLFLGMRKSQIKRVILVSDVKEYGPGQAVMRQGDVGDEVYVVLEGMGEVWRHYRDGSSRRLSLAGVGDVLGEVALMGHGARTADVVAVDRMTVLVLDWDGMERIARFFPHIASRLFRNIGAILAGRVRSIEERQIELSSPVAGVVSVPMFEQELKLAIDRARRAGRPSSLVLFCLQPPEAPEVGPRREEEEQIDTRIAAIVARHTRQIDVFCRTPDGMLCLLLGDTHAEQAREVAWRIRESIEAELGMAAEQSCLAAGVCEVSEVESAEEAMERVREAMGKARAGREILTV